MRSFQFDFCSRYTAAIKFLWPPHLQKFKIAAANVRAIVCGHSNSAAAGELLLTTEFLGRTAAIANVSTALLVHVLQA